MQFYKIVKQSGRYNGKTSDTGIYKLINVQTYDQLDMFFNSIDEAIKYCNKKGYTAISPEYSLDQKFNLQNIQKYIMETNFKGKTVQKQNLSKSQVKLKKYLKPIVEGIINEEKLPSETETLAIKNGQTLASLCKWDAIAITAAYLYALEDANFHPEKRKLIPILNKMFSEPGYPIEFE